MDPELSNFAEWGGAAAPNEPHPPPKAINVRRSPNRSSGPQKAHLSGLPKNGVQGIQNQPLPPRPHVYAKREEPVPLPPNKLPYSSVVKDATEQNDGPTFRPPFKQNGSFQDHVPFNSRSGPKQKDHLRQPNRPAQQNQLNGLRKREYNGRSSTLTARNGLATNQKSGTPKEGFAKVRPRDVGEEQRSEMRDMLAKETAQYTQLLEPSIVLPYELWFYWPDGAVDIEKLKSDYDQSALKEIRIDLHCRIAFDIPGKIIRCYAANESDLPKIQGRLLGLYREFTSKWNHQNTINLFNIPTFANFSSWINVPARTARNTGDKDSAGRLARPELDEERPEAYFKDEADRRRSKSLRANNRLMKKAIEICIKDLRLTDHHVQMRLNMGDMVLSRYRNSANMKPMRSSMLGHPDQRYYQYSLEEFEDMISEELAEMDLRNIPSSQFDHENMIARISVSDIFSQPEECYTLEFDFIQTDSKQVLRHIVEYRKSNTVDELEACQRHWLEVPRNEKHLALNIIDFESYDVQFLVTALRRFTNTAVLSQLSDFEGSVTFTPPKDGLRSEVRHRSRYKPGARSPDIVREKYILTFPIKNSNLAFELARHDTFRPMDARPFMHVESKPTSEWSFALFDQEWDNKLGELAYLGAGQEVTWPRTLRTFFPAGSSAAAGASRMGFKKFIADVGMVTAFLAENKRAEDC